MWPPFRVPKRTNQKLIYLGFHAQGNQQRKLIAQTGICKR